MVLASIIFVTLWINEKFFANVFGLSMSYYSMTVMLKDTEWEKILGKRYGFLYLRKFDYGFELGSLDSVVL